MSNERSDVVELEQNSSEIEEKAEKAYKETLGELGKEQSILNDLSEKIFSQIGGFEFGIIKNKIDQLSVQIQNINLKLKNEVETIDNLDTSTFKGKITEYYNDLTIVENLIKN